MSLYVPGAIEQAPSILGRGPLNYRREFFDQNLLGWWRHEWVNSNWVDEITQRNPLDAAVSPGVVQTYSYDETLGLVANYGVAGEVETGRPLSGFSLQETTVIVTVRGPNLLETFLNVARSPGSPAS